MKKVSLVCTCFAFSILFLGLRTAGATGYAYLDVKTKVQTLTYALNGAPFTLMTFQSYRLREGDPLMFDTHVLSTSGVACATSPCPSPNQVIDFKPSMEFWLPPDSCGSLASVTVVRRGIVASGAPLPWQVVPVSAGPSSSCSFVIDSSAFYRFGNAPNSRSYELDDAAQSPLGFQYAIIGAHPSTAAPTRFLTFQTTF